MKRTLLYILVGIAIVIGLLKLAKHIYNRGVEDGYHATIDELIGNIREIGIKQHGNAAILTWMFNKTDYVM